jgi:hypothetical protein
MNSSQLSNEDSDIKLFKVFNKLKNAQHSKISHKELKKEKQENESLIMQLSESLALIDFLRSENTMLFNIVDTVENKLKESENPLKKFSSDNLKSMLCIHSDISNKPGLIIDDLSASTSHTSDFELDPVDIKTVIVDAACSRNSCLNNCVKPNSKDSGTQGKFVPMCHHCGKVGHTRPKCYLLKSHRPWKKREDSKQGVIEKTFSDKYVPPHRRHISKRVKDFIVCENASLNLQSPSRSISANEVSLPAIIVVSLDTSGHTVLRSDICSLGSGKQSKR